MQEVRVLIADDYATGREGLASLLREEAYLVRTFAYTALSPDHLLSFAPRVVLLALPREDHANLAVIGNIREVLPECVLIVVACSSDVSTALAALKAGANAYLPKPLHFPYLLVTLRLCTRDLHRMPAEQPVTAVTAESYPMH